MAGIQRTEKKLRLSEQNYCELVRNVNSIVLRMDPQGRATFINSFAQIFFGFTESEIIGQNVVGTIVPKTESSGRDLEDMILDIGRNPQRYVNNQNENIKKDGSRAWILWTNTPLLNPDGSVKEILCIGNDFTEHKMTENMLEEKVLERTAELQKTKDFLFNVLESSLDGIVISDRQGYLQQANDSFVKLLGYTRDEIFGKHLSELAPHQQGTYQSLTGETVAIDESYFADNFNMIAQLNNEEKISQWETYLLRKDNTLVPVEETIVNLYDNNRERIGTVGLLRDVTERKQSEKTLQESERFLSSVFLSIQDGISVLDRDLTVIRVNDVMNKWNAENLPLEGKKCYECYHNYEKPCDPCPTIRCLQTGKTEQDIVPGLPGSKVKWLELFTYPIKDPETGETTGVVEFVRDITERIQAEEALKISDERYHLSADHIPLHLGYIDNSYCFKFWNKYSEKMLGYTSDEALGKMTPYDLHETKEEAEEIARVAGEKDFYSKKINLRHKNGTLIPVHLMVVSQKSEDGKTSGLYGFAEDITERKKSEEAFILYQEKLRMLASELALAEERERKEIAQDLHDQIGTSLSAAKLDLSRIGKKLGTVHQKEIKEVEKSINTIITQVQTLTLEVSPLLLYSGGLVPAIKELGAKFGKKYGFNFSISHPKELPRFPEDVRAVLYRSVRELLFNIVKHADAHHVTIMITLDGKSLGISITDDGSGFSPLEIKARDKSCKRGYGLFSIQERVNYMQGIMEIESDIGQGTRISISIPVTNIDGAAA